MPNSRQVSPDVTEDDREAAPPRPSNSNNNMEQDVAVGHGHHGPGAGIARRDENSISFRHFLQPHSDVVPAPAPTCRSRGSRGTQPGAVDLVDGVMALPDFVQDHLVVESLADHQNNSGASHPGASSVDLNVLNEILAQPANTLPAHGMQPRRRNMPEEPAVVPESHGGGAGGTSALPDFLSDGPMQCTDSNVVDNTLAATSSSRSASRMISSNSLGERSRVVDETSRSSSFDTSETMRSEVERLRRDVSERNIRISQLEGEIVRLRTIVSALESALRTAEERPHGSKGSNSGAGDLALASFSSYTGIKVNGRVPECTEIDAQAVREIAQSSETLISQLLQNMARLKGYTKSSSQQGDDGSDDEK